MAWVENKEIIFSKTGRWTLYPISDLQIGSESCDMSLIRRVVKEISSDPKGVSVILGDIEDEDRPSTRIIRKKIEAERPEVISRDAQKHLAWIDKEVIPVLMPLAEMPLGIAGVLAGHHWTSITSQENSVQYICRRLSEKSGKKVPYLGQMSAWIWMRFRSDKGTAKGRSAITKLIHIQHGDGGGQTLASALTRLERTAQGFPADFYIRAHDCKIVAAKTVEVFPKMTEGEPCLMSKDIGLLNIGSATRGYNLTKSTPDYIEQAMMRPTAMGWGKVHMDIAYRKRNEDPNHNLDVEFKIEI